MSILAEALTEKDLLLIARIIGGAFLLAVVIVAFYKAYQVTFGKFVTLIAFRSVIDPMTEQIKALQQFQAQTEEERNLKMVKLIEKYELLLEEREERRKKR